jgi:hypothetical protein
LRGFNSEIAPWTSTERLKMEKETSRDKALKSRIKVTNALLKAAQENYAGIYAETGSLPTRYNAALLTLPLDGLDAAISLMSSLVNATGYTRARTELARLKEFSSENAAAAANQTGTSARDVVVKRAADRLIEALPAGSRVSLLNISASEKDMVDLVVREVKDHRHSRWLEEATLKGAFIQCSM